MRGYRGLRSRLRVLGRWKMTDLRTFRTFLKTPFLTALAAAAAFSLLSLPALARAPVSALQLPYRFPHAGVSPAVNMGEVACPAATASAAQEHGCCSGAATPAAAHGYDA